MQPRLVEVRRNVLKRNDVLAAELRRRFAESNVFVTSLVSSPGTGKTEFLEKTLTRLRPVARVAALVIHAQIRRDAKQPGRKTAGGIEGFKASEGSDEGLLGQVLRFLPVVDHPPDQTQHLPAVLFEQLRVGALVIGQAPLDQVCIIVTTL
jgi:hypothetical protein